MAIPSTVGILWHPSGIYSEFPNATGSHPLFHFIDPLVFLLGPHFVHIRRSLFDCNYHVARVPFEFPVYSFLGQVSKASMINLHAGRPLATCRPHIISSHPYPCRQLYHLHTL